MAQENILTVTKTAEPQAQLPPAPHDSGVVARSPEPRADDLPSLTSIKHYEMIRKLGQGGMGAVFLARDVKLGRLVALKLLRERGRAAERLLAEAQATAQCRHDNIVIIHEADEHQGYPYMVLEYLEGRTLRAFLADSKSVPLRVAVELMIPVVRALVCAHQLGIIHRDLKPENIFLLESGQVKVLDFGIAGRIDAESDDFTQSRGGGTRPYMSPEQSLGAEVDQRCDIWAMGIILYEIATGAHPLAPLTMSRLDTIADLDEPMPSLSQIRPDLAVLSDITDRCLNKHLSERLASASELLDALTSLLSFLQAPEIETGSSPFAGLSALQEADAGRFFGRERDVSSVMGRLPYQPLITVAGPSGAGKSSFVRAGVITAFKRGAEHAEVFVVRPGCHPLAAIAEILARIEEALDLDEHTLVESLRSQPGLLGMKLRERCRGFGDSGRALIFVDQFEELYTLVSDPEERAIFLSCLGGAADDASSPVRVLLSMRSDFLDRVAEDRRFTAELTRGLFILPPMGRDGQRGALVRPIEAAGYRFESEEMVEAMLDALSRARCPLPLLQFTAAKLWETRDAERRLLTLENYQKLGGVEGALSTHADAILAALSPREQALCKAVALRLVTPERTRVVVSAAELRDLSEDSREVDNIVQRLADARLVLVETAGGQEGATVELVHESLIERWSALGRWLSESVEDARFLARLRAAAEPWEASGEAEGLLWRDRAAEEASQWLARQRAAEIDLKTTLGRREEKYLLAVVALSQRARRRRIGAVVGAFATLLAGALVVFLLAIRAEQQAKRADEEAARVKAQNAELERNALRIWNTGRVIAAREQSEDPTLMLSILREVDTGEVPQGWAELVGSAFTRGVARVETVGSEPVYSGAWSPDGKRIVTACHDRLARVWNADGTKELLVLRGHDSPVWTAAWSPDSAHIVTASLDTTARIWKADGSGESIVLRGHTGRLISAFFSPSGARVVTASEDKTARVWSSDGHRELVVLHHEADVNTAAWSPDEKSIVTASDDGAVRVWRADGAGKPLVLRGHEGPVMAAAPSPDGTRIASVSVDQTLRIWDARGEGEPRVLRGHTDQPKSVAWSPDGKRIATASKDKTARIWNADGSGEPIVLQGHKHWVYTAKFSPDSGSVITVSLDRAMRIWDVESIHHPLVLTSRGTVKAVDYSPDGTHILTSSTNMQIWRADGTGEPLSLPGNRDAYRLGLYNPDGTRVAAAFSDNSVQIWNADGSAAPIALRGHPESVTDIVWSPHGDRIASASRDGTVRLWQTDGARELCTFDIPKGEWIYLDMSPDGAHLVMGSTTSKEALVRRTDCGGEPIVLRGHEGNVAAARWSPDGTRVLTCSQDRTARIWHADGSGSPIVLRGHERNLVGGAWSADGKRIVTWSTDATARVFPADGSGEAVILRGHAKEVIWSSFSPDGKRIATTSLDNTARVWNADGSGIPLVLKSSRTTTMGFVKWSPDGTHIVIQSDDSSARIWSHVEPLGGLTDPKLWTATTYCIPIEVQMALLGVTEAEAQADLQKCRRRVDEARTSP